MRERLRAVPAWGWLAALVTCSTVVRFLFARHMAGPWIMIDEIVYSELAKSLASTGHLAVREVPTTGYGFVYPLLISPAYALFREIPTVYTAIKAIDSLLMSLAAVPSYLLARRVVSQRGALIVALLAVAVPSTFYAGTVMTENAFYPIFLATMLALTVALERRTAGSVVVFLVALAVAYETRAQAVAILAAALTAPLVVAALARRPRLALEHRLLYAVAGGLAVLAVLAEIVRGRSIRSLLGAYAAAADSNYGAASIAKWLLWHLAELDFYVGFVPLLAVVLLCARGRALATADRAVIAVTVSTVAWLGLEVAAFASQPSVQRIEERNLFYVAPLLFTCLVLWFERGLPRPRIPMLAGGAAVVALAAAVPYERFIDTSATSDTFGVLALWSFAEWTSVHAADIRWAVAWLALVLVVVAAFVRGPYVLVLPAAILALYAAAVQPVDTRTQRASIGAVFQGITRPDRDWITKAVGSTDPRLVSVVWTARTDRLTVNENEFFNRAVGTVYTTNGAVPGGLAETPVSVSRATGRYLADGKPVRVRDLLTDTSVAIAGDRVAADRKKGLVLLKVDGLLRAPYLTDGIDPDAWAGRAAVYRRFDCTGGRLAVQLGSDPQLFHGPQRVSATVRGRQVATARVRPRAPSTMHVPLSGVRGTCTVRFTAAFTRVPADVVANSTDTRALGVRFLSFRYEP